MAGVTSAAPATLAMTKASAMQARAQMEATSAAARMAVAMLVTGAAIMKAGATVAAMALVERGLGIQAMTAVWEEPVRARTVVTSVVAVKGAVTLAIRVATAAMVATGTAGSSS